MKNILVSFVHGYRTDDINIKKDQLPCLVTLDKESKSIKKFYSLPFPRTPLDFEDCKIKDLLIGETPLKKQKIEFKKLPRFGVMGLAQQKNVIYAATWNGIYSLSAKTMKIKNFISNRLINDPHGIFVKDDTIFSVLTALDLVVITNRKTGEIEDFFSIDRNLKIIRDKKILKFDWRFISKQQRGALGNWHFNHIRIHGDNIYLTSRLTSSVLQVNYKRNTVSIRTVCWDTPVMIHDGRLFKDGNLVFTSVDGKILVARQAGKMKSGITSMHDKSFHQFMKRDMVNISIRLSEKLKRDINWCRGIEQYKNEYITTIDGRYDQDRPYFNIVFYNQITEKIRLIKIPYRLLDFPNQIRYMTGFSVLTVH